MKREVRTLRLKEQPLAPPDAAHDVRLWLETQVAGAGQMFFLLAHADDGVIWGKTEDGRLVTAPETEFSPPLNMTTLQNARLFNEMGEVFLWRDGDNQFHARALIDSDIDSADGEGDPTDYYDEDQILWGNRSEVAEGGFTQMSDGAQGLRHIVPITVEQFRDDRRPMRLTVRHYLSEDSFGFVRVARSRLVKVHQAQGRG